MEVIERIKLFQVYRMVEKIKIRFYRLEIIFIVVVWIEKVFGYGNREIII